MLRQCVERGIVGGSEVRHHALEDEPRCPRNARRHAPGGAWHHTAPPHPRVHLEVHGDRPPLTCGLGGERRNLRDVVKLRAQPVPHDFVDLAVEDVLHHDRP